ncbi:protein Wnt-4 isoform X2 [Cephus cinctus]|uniref:Protein Wnt n=1 Tax=Cephus cinctus TaxID=211228 RepID=A0AAJ7CGX5_CEPCN|nr:protein Wnt-4 isoform X2 [Cephus cinctus]
MLARHMIVLLFLLLLNWIGGKYGGLESTILSSVRNLVATRNGSCPKRLRNLCAREVNLTDVLEEAISLSLEHCQDHFRYTRWNCTINHRLFQIVSRETAMVTAFVAASLVQTLTRACGNERFSVCRKSLSENFTYFDKQLVVHSQSDDLHFGRRMAHRILGLPRRKRKVNKTKRPLEDVLMAHNAQLGLQVVAEFEDSCQCHGVSGSCSIKSCKRRLVQFEKPAKFLRERYPIAARVESLEESSKKKKMPRRRLVYAAASPNFCKLTHGRECSGEMNCSTLCCGRGFLTRDVRISKRCKCKMFPSCCNLKCETCFLTKTIYTCK